MKKLTNKHLWIEVAELNDRFFDGKIVINKIGFSKSEQIEDGDAAYFPGQRMILVDERLKGFPRIVRLILVHELAHAKLDQVQEYRGYPEDAGHGQHFCVEIDRLYKIGAYDGLL